MRCTPTLPIWLYNLVRYAGRALEASIDYKLMKDYSESHTQMDFTLMVGDMKLKHGLAYNSTTVKLF